MFPLRFAGRLGERAIEDAERAVVLPDRLRRMAAADLEPTPYDVVYEESPVSLRRYEPDERRYDTPLVIAYAFINEPSILDLQEDRSVVGQFLDRGFAVYVVDWGHPTRLDTSLTLDDYVVRYLDDCVDAAREDAGAETVHLHGYSTGAPVAAMYAALFPEKVRTLGLQGPPLNYDVEEGMFAFRELFETTGPELVSEAFGNVPAPLVDLAFSVRKPVEYTATVAAHGWDDLLDPAAIEHDARKARWVFDGPDMAGATYRQFVEELVERNALLESELELAGRTVDLGNVDMPVLLVIGRDDAFIPEAASLPFLDAVASEDTAVFEFPTGHVGLSVSPEAHEHGWPRVTAWYAERSGERHEASSPSAFRERPGAENPDRP